MTTPKRSPEELTQAAWEAINELTYTGRIVLPNGAPILPEAKTVIDVFKWLAQFQGKPKKTPKAMDDWKPPETKQ